MAATTVALFDFDKTLTFRDTLWPFMQFTHGTIPAYSLVLPKLPLLTGYCVGVATRQKTKETMIGTFYRDMPIELLRQRGKEFALSQLKRHLRPEAVKRLKWHQAQGHRCILVSASLDVYLEPWGKAMGFSDVIASQLEVSHSGSITGHLNGKNCWGPEKTRRLAEVLGDLNAFTFYVYGDSRGDREMLEIARYPFYRKFS